MSESIWQLKRCRLFERLSPDELGQLESSARMRRFARKSLVYLPADEANAVLLLVSGQIKIFSISQDGKESILGFVDPGELFGELSLLEASSDREEFAAAVERSDVVLIPHDVVQRLMQRHTHVAMEVTRLLGLRSKRIERRLKYLMFRSNRERLVHLLLELSEKYGEPTPEGMRLTIKLSHQDLASLIGSTRESVTVALGELQNEGLVRLARRKIVLRDINRMAKSAQVVLPHEPSKPAALSSFGGARTT